MNTQAILARKDDVVAKYGPWIGHNIHLQDDIYTISPSIVGDEIEVRRIVQCVRDLSGGTVENLRVLDLACGEGIYGVELARQKANVVAVEGRQANIEKARLVKQVLSLDNLELVQDDVRNLSRDKYGVFDVVLCLGILYHLKAPDVFSFAERIGEVCRRMCIVDTRVTMHAQTQYAYNGDIYSGTWGEEHWPGDSQEVKLSRLAASLENEYSFWLTRPTVYNLLSRAGFTSVYECHIPVEPKETADRITFVAMKGEPCHISYPLMAAQACDKMPERPFREHGTSFYVLRAAGHLLPRSLRKLGKRLLLGRHLYQPCS